MKVLKVFVNNLSTLAASIAHWPHNNFTSCIACSLQCILPMQTNKITKLLLIVVIVMMMVRFIQINKCERWMWIISVCFCTVMSETSSSNTLHISYENSLSTKLPLYSAFTQNVFVTSCYKQARAVKRSCSTWQTHNVIANAIYASSIKKATYLNAQTTQQQQQQRWWCQKAKNVMLLIASKVVSY